MQFMIYADIPDEDIKYLQSALKVVSQNPNYKDLRKCDFNNIQQITCGYVAKNLWQLVQDFKDIKNK